MATQITNQASLTFLSSGREGVAMSNVAITTLQETLTGVLTALGTTYSPTSPIVYLITLTNSGTQTLTDITITHDLGTYPHTSGSLTPLTYVGPAHYYQNGVFLHALTPTQEPNSIAFTISSLPPKTTGQIIYQVETNSYAPLAQGSTITSTATIESDVLTDPLVSSVTLTIASQAQVEIIKRMEPNPITTGSTLTYQFTIYNYGNAPATDVVFSDIFSPAPTPESLLVSVNDTPLNVMQYAYDSHLLTIPNGAIVPPYQLPIPEAAFLQLSDGTYQTNPGTTQITVTGII